MNLFNMKGYFATSTAKYLENYSGLPKDCWRRIYIYFINAISGGISFFLSFYLVNNLHFNVGIAGFIISFYGLGTILGGILGGKLADELSPTIMSLISLLVKVVSLIALVFLHTKILLMTNLFILGVANYSFLTSNNAWILHRCRENERLKVLNILYAASNLGLGVAGIIFGFLVHYDFQYALYFSSISLLACIVYLLKEEKRKEILSNKYAEAIVLQKTKSGIINKKIFWLMLVYFFFSSLIIAQVGTTYPLYLREVFSQSGVKIFGMLFALNSFIIAGLQTPIVNIFKDANKAFIAGMGSLVMGLGMLMLSFTSLTSLALVSCLVYTFGEMLFIPMAQLICYQQGDAKKKGQNLGLFQTIYAAAVVFGPSLGGFIYHHFSGKAVWYFCGTLGVICFFGCLIFQKYFATKVDFLHNP